MPASVGKLLADIKTLEGGGTGTLPVQPAAALLANNTALPIAKIEGAVMFGQYTNLALFIPSIDVAADARTAGGAPLVIVTEAGLFNGTNWDRQRGCYEQTVLASATRTLATDSADLTNYNARGVIVVIDVTSLNAVTPIITVTIQGKSSLGSDYYTILAAAAISTVSVTVLRIYPGLTAVANLTASDVLPRIWRASVAVADADAMDYSINAIYIP